MIVLVELANESGQSTLISPTIVAEAVPWLVITSVWILSELRTSATATLYQTLVPDV